MKAKIGLCLLAVLLCSSMAFAVNGTGFYNLTKRTSGIGPMGIGSNATQAVVLSQGTVACTEKSWNTLPSSKSLGVCIASVKDTPSELAALLKKNWIDAANMKGVSLELGSNIDLGEFSSGTKQGECDENHVPLPLMDSTSVDGKGFIVSHLCYAQTVTAKSPMTYPVGLFEKSSEITLKGIRLNGYHYNRQ